MTAPSGTGLFVVRVSTKGRSWTSPGMDAGDAEIVADQFEDQVQQHGDGFGFVPFVGREGRQIAIRARDVVTIEVAPERDEPGGVLRSINGAIGAARVAGAPR